MKQIKVIAVVALVIVIAASCKKEKISGSVPTPVPGTAKQLKQIDIVYSNGNAYFMKFSYDAQARIIKTETTDDIITQSYADNKIAITEFRQSKNAIVGQSTANIGTTGKVYKQTGNYNYNGNPYTLESDIVYDNNGYAVNISQLRSNGDVYVYEYTVSNGNITKIKYSVNGAELYTDSFEYYTDKTDKTSIANVYFSTYWAQGELGKQSVNLVKSRKTTYPGSSSVTTLNYTYDTDAQGYVVKATCVSSSGLTRTDNYSWQ